MRMLFPTFATASILAFVPATFKNTDLPTFLKYKMQCTLCNNKRNLYVDQVSVAPSLCNRCNLKTEYFLPANIKTKFFVNFL